jgi:hypothetical protein
VGIFRALDRNGDDVVLLEDLDGALGTAPGFGDEQDGVAALAERRRSSRSRGR